MFVNEIRYVYDAHNLMVFLLIVNVYSSGCARDDVHRVLDPCKVSSNSCRTWKKLSQQFKICEVKTKDKHDLCCFEDGRSILIERAVVISDVRVRRPIRIQYYSPNTGEEQLAILKIKFSAFEFSEPID